MSHTLTDHGGADPLRALAQFFMLATCHSHSGARVAAHLLLCLYNGTRFPFDLTDLRCLDAENLQLALTLLQFDARPQMEVHQWLNQMYGRTDFGMRFEHLAHAWKLKGRCKKEHLDPVPRLRWDGDAEGSQA
ncbi:DUF7673 family protein [Delftia sp. DT-2]|jgi:hypothetical protein|uniref:DUF7673 family protein n=1 Tax=Delftia sp. DT-2 TaxID=3022772 RepID=UPI00233EB0F4|nr:hypothetical protein [Delftia sp. DT-2]MDC2857310.1 hypothetical protein [Delftia sp. DT-2]MDR3016468.1 hypothetical protein [Delftia acidovorans]